MQATLLFWRHLSNTIKEWGFKLNEYDSVVTNKTINGNQCMIVWHFDVPKISYNDNKLIEYFMTLSEKFGKRKSTYYYMWNCTRIFENDA